MRLFHFHCDGIEHFRGGPRTIVEIEKHTTSNQKKKQAPSVLKGTQRHHVVNLQLVMLSWSFSRSVVVAVVTE